MADKKSPSNVLVCESQESLYEKAVKKMEADKMIVQHAYKIENYMTAATMFDTVGDYQDAAEMAKKCRQLADETRELAKKDTYEKASRKIENADTIGELEKLEAVFGKLGNFEDAPARRQECTSKLNQIKTKQRRKGRIVIGVLVVLLCLVLYGLKAGYFRYAFGRFYEIAGMDERAAEAFETTGTLLDSEERLAACQDRLQTEKEKEELQTLKKAQPGGAVSFGGFDWRVLERDGSKLRLIMGGAKQEGYFYHVPYHEEQKEVLWEECSLRTWINSGILQETFSEMEKDLMVPQEDGDLVTILSLEEAENYKSTLDIMAGLDYWLKTQGDEANKEMFITGGDIIFEAGFPVTTQEISVRPVILIDCA